MRRKRSRLETFGIALLTIFLTVGAIGCNNDDDDDDADTGMVEDTGMADTGMDTGGDTVDDTGGDTTADSGADTEDDGGADADGGTDATARIQIIHNAADPAASTVDVFLNGSLLLNDFAFRTATPFVDAPAGVDLSVTIATSDAADTVGDPIEPTDTTIEEFTGLRLDEDGTYIAIANGVADPNNFAANPDGEDIAVDLKLFDQAKEDSSADGETDEVLVFHGATDAPTVDVIADNDTDSPAVDDATYGDFAGYLELPAGIHTLDITTADNSTRVVSLQTPELAGGDAYTVVASGFLTPEDNNSGPGFALVAFPTEPAQGDSVVQGIELGQAARLQVVHNSPDPGAATVDVYVNEAKLLDDFGFLSATPFISVPADTDLDIDVAGPMSSDAGDAVVPTQTVSLMPGSTTVAVASGVLDPSQFEGSNNGFMIRAGEAREMADTSGNVEFNIFHGSTDATAFAGGPVDVVVTGGGPTLADDLAFGTFSGIQSVAPMSYTLDVTTSDNSVTAASFTADLSMAADAYLTVMAKGFVTTDDGSDPMDGEPFGLVAFDAEGNRIDLPAAGN